MDVNREICPICGKMAGFAKVQQTVVDRLQECLENSIRTICLSIGFVTIDEIQRFEKVANKFFTHVRSVFHF